MDPATALFLAVILPEDELGEFLLAAAILVLLVLVFIATVVFGAYIVDKIPTSREDWLVFLAQQLSALGRAAEKSARAQLERY